MRSFNLLLLPFVAVSTLASIAAAQVVPSPMDKKLMRGVIETHLSRIEAYHREPDTQGTGPYRAVKMIDPAFPGHVVYRPADLYKMEGHKLPILLWGNAGCLDDGAADRHFLAELASHGFLL